MPHASNFGEPASEPYQAWSADRQIPMSTEEIEDIFLDLTQKFGFQRDSMRNMVGDLPFTSIDMRSMSYLSSISPCNFWIPEPPACHRTKPF